MQPHERMPYIETEETKKYRLERQKLRNPNPQGFWKPKFTDPVEVLKLVNEYFDKCDEEGEPYLITGLALALKTNRMTLLNWIKFDQNESQDRSTTLPIDVVEEISGILKYAKARCEHYGAKGLLKGTINPAAAIFNLKANYKWVDRNEVDITSGNEKMNNIGNINIMMPEGAIGEGEDMERIDGGSVE